LSFFVYVYRLRGGILIAIVVSIAKVSWSCIIDVTWKGAWLKSI
jgi:hypothetical protein